MKKWFIKKKKKKTIFAKICKTRKKNEKETGIISEYEKTMFCRK